MGKSNRIRTQRAEKVVNTSQVTKEKKGVPSWLYPLIAIVVMVGVIFGVATTFLSSSGIIFRSQKAIKSENYAISGTVLQYMFFEQYNAFVSENQNYLSLYGLDTAHGLEEQKYTLDDSTENTIDTWYDYFMEATVKQANEILIYCEEADKRGIKLEDADKASIDSTISQIEIMVSYYNMLGYGYTIDSYISTMYGEGIKEKDIRNYLELYTLATKCAGIVGEELLDAITADRINAEYDANPNNYNVVDYDVFSVRVSYSDIQKEFYPNSTTLTDTEKELVLKEYTARVLQAELDKSEFSAISDVAEFETKLLTNTIDRNFNKLYNKEALADADKISEDALLAIRSAMTVKLLAEVFAGEKTAADDTTEADGKFYAYDQQITENAAKAIDSIKTSLFTTLTSLKASSFIEDANYSETSDASKWAFETTAAGSVKIESSGDASVDGVVENKEGFYSASVYILKTPAHRDETVSKNVYYMTFTTEDAAKAAIEVLKGFEKVDTDSFSSVATATQATDSGSFESYLKGGTPYTELDKWLFDDNAPKGSYTETPLLLSEAEDSKLYGVFFYDMPSDTAWYLAVKSAIYGTDADAKYEELLETYPVTVNEKVTDKISA